MKNTKKLIDMLIIALFVFLGASCALRAVALFNSFNTETMHFDNSATFTLSAIFTVAASLLFLSTLIIVPNGYKLAPDCSAPALFIPSGIVSVAFLFMASDMFMRAYTHRVPTASVAEQIIKYIPLALAIFALLSAASFFLNIILAKRTSSAKAILGMCTVVFLALYGAYLYFNKETHPTNSPNKIADQMAYFFSAIFFLFETRIALSRDAWKPYIAFGFISAFLTGYSAIPALIYYFGKGISISDSITETVLTLTIFLYVLTKLLLMRRLPSDEQCKMASAIERLASQREAELEERRKALRAGVYNNVETDSRDSTSSENATNENEAAEGQISFELDAPTDSLEKQ